MIGVITGDIKGSKTISPAIWLEKLKEQLKKAGTNPEIWEIYRGDSFQILIKDPYNVLEFAIKIKSSIRMIKGMDVRISIGLGSIEYKSVNIKESNGSAFVFSGEQFDRLKKEHVNLAIKSGNDGFDQEINLYLKLLLLFMDRWTVNSAEIVKICLENPMLSQEQIGKKLGIKQNAVSTRLKRASFDELNEVLAMFKVKLQSIG